MKCKSLVSIIGKSFIILSMSILLFLGLIYPVSAAEDYLSMGIGVANREMHPEYPLKLEFSLRTGHYVSDVDVNIFQNSKKIKSIQSSGPWLYIDLDPGNYSVVATLDDGSKQGAQFTITRSEQQLVILSWPR